MNELRKAKALELFDEMKKRKVKADVITFNGLISCCEDSNGALNFMNQMKDYKLRPDLVTFNAAVSACERSNRPDQALE